MNFLWRLYHDRLQRPRNSLAAIAVNLCHQTTGQGAFAVMSYNMTLRRRIRTIDQRTAQQCDRAREHFISPSETTVTRLRGNGISAWNLTEFELATEICERAINERLSIFLLSRSGVADIRLAARLTDHPKITPTIAGSAIIETPEDMRDQDTDRIIRRIEDSGAALCFAGTDPAFTRRLAARARKQRVACGFFILPKGFDKLAAMTQVPVGNRNRWGAWSSRRSSSMPHSQA